MTSVDDHRERVGLCYSEGVNEIGTCPVFVTPSNVNCLYIGVINLTLQALDCYVEAAFSQVT